MKPSELAEEICKNVSDFIEEQYEDIHCSKEYIIQDEKEKYIKELIDALKMEIDNRD